MKKLIVMIFLVTLNSCGKAQSSPVYVNECAPRIISGRDCIVCEHGGVSCDWR